MDKQDDPVAAEIGALVEAGRLAGAVTLVWRGGRVVQQAAVGWRDLESRAPMTRDTLFRIASMTKPITSVAALILMERGRFALEDPITRVSPEFAQMRVLRAADGPLDQTVPAARPITFGDLLTHRSGLTYGGFHAGPLAGALAALGGDIDSPLSPDEWIATLARLPLVDQPGAGFHYGHSTDLLGLLLARIEGAPLGEVLRELVFEPLGMTDTGFTVPQDRRHRRASDTGFTEAGLVRPARAAPGGATVADRPEGMLYQSGGQGLWSTVDDYLAFARCFVDPGGWGARLMRRETWARMVTDQLTSAQREAASIFGMPLFGAGHGFGLGVAVVTDPAKADVLRGRGSIGTVGWPGAYGGWWQADPADASVLIFLAHNMAELDQMATGIGLDVYGAIARFHDLALRAAATG